MVMVPAALLATAGLAYAAHRIAGFLGIGVLGLLIGFIAVQVDLESGGPVGGVSTNLYAQHMTMRQSMSRSERDAAHAEMQSMRRPLTVAKLIAAALIALGVGGFFYLD
jgi:hypothetical protein